MKDYSATITFVYAIRAKNQREALYRARALTECLEPSDEIVNKPWLGDLKSCGAEVDEEVRSA